MVHAVRGPRREGVPLSCGGEEGAANNNNIINQKSKFSCSVKGYKMELPSPKLSRLPPLQPELKTVTFLFLPENTKWFWTVNSMKMEFICFVLC